MTVSIFAGATTDLYWNAEAREFTTTANDGPKFTVQQLDFWQAQVLYDKSLSESERCRALLTAGLVHVDGSKETAARFIASPNALMVNPLINQIVANTLGN